VESACEEPSGERMKRRENKKEDRVEQRKKKGGDKRGLTLQTEPRG
jgi:hypothetical protein